MNRKKKFLLKALLLFCFALLVGGCGKSADDHKHKWTEATCKEPKTCTICGLTEGEPSERHKWTVATCTEPSRCTVCGETKDAPQGHEEGDWTVESEATLSENGERVLRCIYCDEVLDTESTEKLIEATNYGFNFDSSEFFAYLEKMVFCDLSDCKTYKNKDVVLETCAVPDNKMGITEVDVISKNGDLVSVLITMNSDEEANYEAVMAALEEKLPEGSIKNAADMMEVEEAIEIEITDEADAEDVADIVKDEEDTDDEVDETKKEDVSDDEEDEADEVSKKTDAADVEEDGESGETDKADSTVENDSTDKTEKSVSEILCMSNETLSWSKDPSVSLETKFDDIFYIALSCKEADLAMAVNTADSILRIPLYIEVDFQSNLFLDKYGVKLELNEEEIASLDHGEDYSNLFIVPLGNYSLRFTGTDEKKNRAEKAFDVKGPTSVLCKIQTHSDEIEFHKFELLNNVDKASSELPDVTGMLLSDAKDLLASAGFKNISVDCDDWIIDEEEYRILKQKPKAGKTCEYKAEVKLFCVPVSTEEATLIGRQPDEDDPVTDSEGASEYEKAYVRKGSSYDIYYLFDLDTGKVINFVSDDSYIMEGTYSGDFEDEVVIDWVDDGFSEKFTEYDDGTAYLIDANGWDWEYKVCDIATAEMALKKVAG